MKCFNIDDLQSYFDKELNDEFQVAITVHLKDCPVCSEKYENVKEKNEFLHKMVSTLNPVEFAILDNHFSLKNPKPKRIVQLIISIIAVAAIVLLIILFGPKNKNPEQFTIEILVQEYLESEDPNELWHNKTHLYFIENESGDLIVISSQ